MQTPGWIDVHHHFAPPDWLKLVNAEAPRAGDVFSGWSVEAALAGMDRGGTQKAMLSITAPGISFGDQAATRRMFRYCNEYAAALATAHPERFGRFVGLPLPDISGSLAEIAYGLDTLKADGIGVFTSYGNTWFGDPQFEPVYAELARRGAVVFVHPVSPLCCSSLLPGITDADIEYGTDTTRAIARLIFSGMAAKYPRMRIIWSHGGGELPFLAWRFRHVLNQAQRFYYDTAQIAIVAPLAALGNLIPLPHILFGSDYPFLTVSENVAGLHTSGIFDPRQLAAIGRGNALALFAA